MHAHAGGGQTVVNLVSLAWFYLKRLVRNRRLAAALIVAPALSAVPRLLFPEASVSLGLIKACPWVCAAAVSVVFYLQHCVDVSSGLVDALKTAPVSGSVPAAARALAATILFAVQMMVLAAVLAAGKAWPGS